MTLPPSDALPKQLPAPRTLSHIAVSFEITASSSSYAVRAALEEELAPMRTHRKITCRIQLVTRYDHLHDRFSGVG